MNFHSLRGSFATSFQIFFWQYLRTDVFLMVPLTVCWVTTLYHLCLRVLDFSKPVICERMLVPSVRKLASTFLSSRAPSGVTTEMSTFFTIWRLGVAGLPLYLGSQPAQEAFYDQCRPPTPGSCPTPRAVPFLPARSLLFPNLLLWALQALEWFFLPLPAHGVSQPGPVLASWGWIFPGGCWALHHPDPQAVSGLPCGGWQTTHCSSLCWFRGDTAEFVTFLTSSFLWRCKSVGVSHLHSCCWMVFRRIAKTLNGAVKHAPIRLLWSQWASTQGAPQSGFPPSSPARPLLQPNWSTHHPRDSPCKFLCVPALSRAAVFPSGPLYGSQAACISPSLSSGIRTYPPIGIGAPSELVNHGALPWATAVVSGKGEWSEQGQSPALNIPSLRASWKACLLLQGPCIQQCSFGGIPHLQYERLVAQRAEEREKERDSSFKSWIHPEVLNNINQYISVYYRLA